VLLVGHEAQASRLPRALPDTKIVSVTSIS
jgi:hypothetical protein